MRDDGKKVTLPGSFFFFFSSSISVVQAAHFQCPHQCFACYQRAAAALPSLHQCQATPQTERGEKSGKNRYSVQIFESGMKCEVCSFSTQHKHTSTLSRRPAVAQLHAEPNVLPDSCFASKNVIQSSSYSSQQLFPYFLINLCITLQIT